MESKQVMIAITSLFFHYVHIKLMISSKKTGIAFTGSYNFI